MNESPTITQFPLFNLYNVPEALRKVANDLEKDPTLCKHIILCGQREDNVVWYKAFGKDFTKVEALGIVETAKLTIAGVLNDHD